MWALSLIRNQALYPLHQGLEYKAYELGYNHTLGDFYWAQELGGGPRVFGGGDGRLEGDAGEAELEREDQEPAAVRKTLLQRIDTGY